jgi:hypothetical protein
MSVTCSTGQALPSPLSSSVIPSILIDRLRWALKAS